MRGGILFGQLGSRWSRPLLPQRTMASTTTTTTTLADRLADVRRRMEAAFEKPYPDYRHHASLPRRLVAVSKTKPKEMIFEAYDAGQRVFGENYVQELYDKSHDPELLSHCPDIRWHFIGNCQTNKAPKLVQVRNLAMVETVTSEKLAEKLNKTCQKYDVKLDVMIQVNTSGEFNKNGMEPNWAPQLAQYVTQCCSNLRLQGVMTIGALGHSVPAGQAVGDQSSSAGQLPHHPPALERMRKNAEAGANPDFASLYRVRTDVARTLAWPDDRLEISMGMSNDFEEAICMGSNSVRVGSTIFGARDYPKKKDDEVDEAAERLKEVKIEEGGEKK